MNRIKDIVIVGAVRTAIGDFGGSLKDVAPTDLGAMVLREAIRRAGITAADVQHVVMGQVVVSEPKDAYLSRIAAIKAGIPVEVPALTLNRLCGSGAQAIVSAAQMILLGECDVVAAGGAESMTRAPFMSPSTRWGSRLGDAQMLDSLLATLNDPFGAGHMGVTAELVAAKYGIDRETQDAFAAESHRRAAQAIAEGRFASQILPIELKSRKGVTIFASDEHVRKDVTAQSLSTLPAAFQKGGTVTAGNASGINDGAAAVIVMSAREAERRKLRALARLISWGHAGVPPEIMGTGPIAAVPQALARAGLKVDDLDVIESNEAFAAQACAVSKALGLPADRTNPNGGAIAMGHPVGATGAIITAKALYELERIGGRYGLVTLCIGGGQGIALIFERIA